MSTIKANTIENVAGTESHSVDTMGIESTVGNYDSVVKFPDGTMIIYGTKSTISVTTIGSGVTYFSPEIAFNFPESFAYSPVVTISTRIPGGGSYPWGKIGSISEDNCTCFLQGTTVTSQAYATYTAVGRWKP